MKRGEVTMHEFDDERPIPLGRAAAASAPRSAEPPARPDDAAPAPAASPARDLRSDAHIEEKTRAQVAPPPPPADPMPIAATTPEPAPAPRAVAVAELQVAEAVMPTAVVPVEVATAPAATAAPQPADQHPLAALRGFRMDVEVVGPAIAVRDLGRFLAAYLVVAAFVLGLIVAFLALTAHV